MSSKKKAATNALLGPPVDPRAGAAEVSVPPATKKRKVKKESDTTGAGAVPTGGSMEKRLTALLSSSGRGMTQDEVCAGLGCNPSDLVDAINNMLNKHRVELLQDGEGQIFYKYVSADKAAQLRGLLPSELLIYQLVEKSGNMGIWIKDLRRKSNLSALEIPKVLKELQKRKLIKAEKSVAATNKKVYMLYDIEPAREISGGAWFDKSTGEFDTEYMKALEHACLMYLEKKRKRQEAEKERRSARMHSAAAAGNSSNVPTALSESGVASAREVEHFLRETGAFKTVPNEEETSKILQGLMFEGRVQRLEDEGAEWSKMEDELGGVVGGSSTKMEVGSSSGGSAADASLPAALARKRKRAQAMASISYVYRFISSGPFQSSLAQVPCATCPVARSCREGNPISPSTCEYYTQWLAF